MMGDSRSGALFLKRTDGTEVGTPGQSMSWFQTVAHASMPIGPVVILERAGGEVAYTNETMQAGEWSAEPQRDDGTFCDEQ